MDWKEDTCEFREEGGESSVVEDRESGVVVGSDTVNEATVDEGVAVDEEDEDERLEECFLDWCLAEREVVVEDVEDDVDGCRYSALTEV